ncbi:hypothetical protein, conserved [Leishmania tarentolae]|uniref:Uncharacterized protein n=1 Tax=Leishmania tarentolae TaxID=5689 RepID=A0A640KMG3_LEITA|nr:hypothetical protein, conserved [Leishmania tarentolae]
MIRTHPSTSSMTGTTNSRIPVSHYTPRLTPVDVVARYTDQLTRGAETRLTRLLRAKAYVHLHDYVSACADLDDWIQKSDCTAHSTNGNAAADSLTEALFYRGVCRARLSQVEDAVADLTEVLQRNPGHRRAQYERAACHARLDDFVNAIADYEAALQLDEVGREKRSLRLYRERRRCSNQRRPQRMRSPSLGTGLGPVPLGHLFVRPPSTAISPLRQQVTISSSESAQLTDVPLTPEQPSTRLLTSTRNAMTSSARRTPAGVSSDIAVGTMPLSEYMMTAAGSGVTTLSVVLGRRNRHCFSGNSHDNLSSVSSSTESFLDSSVMKADEALEEASASRTHEIAASYSPRDESLENGHDMPTAMDMTGILSTNKSEEEAVPLDDVLEAEAWQQSEGSRSATDRQSFLDADYFYQRGLEHRRGGELEAAIHMYTKALELSPRHFKALFNRAFCEDKLQNYERAIEDYTAALDLDPSNPFTHYNLGISYDHKGNHSRAIQAFTRAIELDNRHPDFFHNRGFMQRKQGAYEAAIADYTTAISLDPKHFKSHYNRAYCFSKLGRYEEAVTDYTSALQIDSDNTNAYHNRGAALAKLGRLEAAIQDFSCALRRSPKLTFALNARGLAYDQLRQYEKAVEDFTEAIRLDQRNPAWLHNRGYTYRNMGELELAIADYSASIKLAPHSYTAYSNRAFAFRKLGRYEAAIEDYTKALRELPGMTTKVLNSRAYCFARLNLFEDAIRDYTEVLVTDPDNVHALYNRGMSFEKCGKYNAAVDDFTRVIQLAPEAPSTANSYYSRGTSRLQLRQVPEAVEDLKQALKLDLIVSRLRGEALHAFQAEHPAWRLLQGLSTN